MAGINTRGQWFGCDCTIAQPEVVVSINGTCDAFCANVDGIIPWHGYTSNLWRWVVPESQHFVSVHKVCTYWAVTAGLRIDEDRAIFGDIDNPFAGGFYQEIPCIMADLGIFTGVIIIDGMDDSGSGGSDCTGCTAEITFGG